MVFGQRDQDRQLSPRLLAGYDRVQIALCLGHAKLLPDGLHGGLVDVTHPGQVKAVSFLDHPRPASAERSYTDHQDRY